MSTKKKLLVFTDTYAHQVNGAKVTLEELARNSPKTVELVIVSTDDFLSIPFPTYTEIRFALVTPHHISSIIRKEKPDMIHIVTEGMIGFAAARACQKLHIPYTSAFHTKFPEYITLRIPYIHEEYIHKALHYIHDSASHIIVSCLSMQSYLEEHNYPKEKIRVIQFGVDHDMFSPGAKTLFQNLPGPILLFVGRVAVEKNIEDFITMDTPGTKIVVGDGPLREGLEENFKKIHFLGYKTKKKLREIYRSADILIFPSITDTLGLVNIEALSCGLPILGYNIGGLSSIVTQGQDGILVPYGKLLKSGIPLIENIRKEACRKKADIYNWEDYTKQFSLGANSYPQRYMGIIRYLHPDILSEPSTGLTFSVIIVSAFLVLLVLGHRKIMGNSRYDTRKKVAINVLWLLSIYIPCMLYNPPER